KRACERLITTVLGADVPQASRMRIAELAGGNPLFLEELIRTAAAGRMNEQPDTVLAMLQARLSCLDPPSRRLLCTASIFGQSFPVGGALALLGQTPDPSQDDALLVRLVQAEIVERQLGHLVRGEAEVRFRHALVRDAAYSLLPEGDRGIGHRLAAQYLEDN